MATLRATIYKLTYCGFSARINDSNKTVYAARYPPSIEGMTRFPQLDKESTEEELRPDSHIFRETMTSFINSPDTLQANGNWKGGQWGINNFTLTSTGWFPGLFIGDTILIDVITPGIIKFGRNPFDRSMSIIPGTEGLAWSCNAITSISGELYPLYLTDNPMPQIACDKLFIWNSPSRTYLKMLKRGVGPSVDSPQKIIPAAGEHVEPGQDSSRRAQAIFAINQEIGIPPETLSKCYLLPLGEYSGQDRDARYSQYSAYQDGQLVTFGFPRGSKTTASIIYIETDSDVEPVETIPEDQVEITQKWWENIYTVLDKHPDSEWMLKDHQRFIPDAVQIISRFKELNPNDKEAFRF